MGEWQDINLPQYRIIQLLARGGSYGDADSVVGGIGSVFVVRADKRLPLNVDAWVHMYERTRMLWVHMYERTRMFRWVTRTNESTHGEALLQM